MSMGKGREKSVTERRFMKKYILFGASKMAETVIKNKIIQTENILCFFDNNPEKWGTTYLQKEIKKPLYNKNAEIVVTSMFYTEIVSQLITMGFRKFHVVLAYEENFSIKSYDYSNYTDFDIIPNKVVLISQNSSGSNAYALNYMYQNFFTDLGLSVVNVNVRDDESYFYDVMTSHVIAYTHPGFDLPGKIHIQLWHGFPLKGLNYTANDCVEPFAEKEHNRWLMMKKIISTGNLYNLLMGASYGLPRSLFEITGFPRNDFLFLSDGKKKLEFLFPESKNKTIIFYMPTFRETIYNQKEGGKSGYLFNWNDFNSDDFDDYCKSNNILFFIKIHPYDYQYMQDTDIKNDSIKILKDEYFAHGDLYEYLNAADILVTDYSSVYFDYLLLDRPIIFLDADFDTYAHDRGFLLHPVDKWRPGITVKDMKNIKEEILNVISGRDDYKERRKWVRDQVHQYQDAFSSERVFKMIQNIIQNDI